MRTSQLRSTRLQVRFSEEDHRRLLARSAELGLPVTTTVRTLTRAALASGQEPRLDELEAIGVAALLAAEQVCGLVQLLIPGGARRAAELAAGTELKALDRLSEVRRQLQESRA
jgi:hypothetical protein